MGGHCAEATPVLVPLLSLGRRVVATPVAGEPAGTVMIAPANVAAGGRALLSTRLSPGLFAAAAMRKVQKDLVAMKVVELKEELGERGEALSGNKAWLRRRLHAAIVSEYLESAPRAPPESTL